MVYIDIHTHLDFDKPFEGIAINNVMAGENPAQAKYVYNSLGIQPWQLKDNKAKELEKKFIKSLSMPNLIAIGEAGIDRSIEIPISAQLPVFMMQADLAAELGIPLITHAVRSYPDLIHIRKQLPGNVVWIVHGFAGNRHSVNELLKHNLYLSMGPSLLQPGHAAAELIQHIPDQNLFLETDNSGFAIRSIYEKAAQLRGVEPLQLMALIEENWRRVFANNAPPTNQLQ